MTPATRSPWQRIRGFVWALVTACSLVYVARTGSANHDAEEADTAAAPAPGPAAATPAPAPAPLPPTDNDARHTLRIGWTAWSDAEFITLLAQKLIEENLPFDVDLVMADIGIQYQGVASGDLDLMLMAWLPLTHAEYWQKYAGSVVNLGPLYTQARLGWVVPAYVPESELGSIEDLKKPQVVRKLGGKIQGIDPGSGLMQASERAISEYGLKLQLVSSSGAAMTTSVGRAFRNEQWVVATAWSPHWMFAKWGLRYLADPKAALGKQERVHALARKGLYQEAHGPELTELLTRLFVPMDELEAALLYANDHSADEAVTRYVAQHPDRVRYWVTGYLKSSGG